MFFVQQLLRINGYYNGSYSFVVFDHHIGCDSLRFMNVYHKSFCLLIITVDNHYVYSLVVAYQWLLLVADAHGSQTMVSIGWQVVRS